MTQYESVRTPQDYVNYTFNISSKGVTQVAGELAGLSSTVSTILGDIAFKTSEFLSHTETMALGAGAAISAVFIKSTQDAIRFEQQVANVKAIGGEAVDANLIGSKAMEYSNKFGMAVSEMTEGLEALARAGITTTSVMAGVLEEGVKLSKLEGIDLEDSINHLISTTNLLSQNNVDMNDPEYAEMLKAMNQHIVSTSESAPINAENIMQTLQHVGGYASASGIDQDDLFAVIAQLGARGTKGEMAGTALRAFIAAGNKDTAQRALKRVGLNVTDLWKDNGETMLSISEMKDVLDSALEAKGYSKQEKLEFYADFAGYKQANQIMKIDTSEVENYKEKISNAWDLGTKLNTILGTVRGNLDRIWEISKNFMTRVGGKLLPIFNAILAPLRIGLELFTKIPFMDSLGAGLALFAGLRTVLLVINNIVPAIGGLFSSMRNQKKYAKGIRGEWEKTRDAIKDAKEVIDAFPNKDKLARIQRKRRGPSAEDKATMEDTIFRAMYYESPYSKKLGIPWEEVTPALQHAIGREFLGTPEFAENWKRMEEENENIAEKIGEYAQILDFGPYDANSELVTINRYVQYIYSFLENNEKNDDDNSNRARNKEARAQQNRQIPTSTSSSSSTASTSTSSSSEPIKIEIINGRQTSKSAFEFDDINQIKANIDVSQYGDYAHIYRNSKEQFIKDYNQAINDLVRKAFSFSNTDKARMDRTQSRRYEKSLRREAMSDEGLEYASRANDSDIRYFLKTGVYRKPRHKMLGIKDNQIKAMARRLGLEGFDDIDNVHGEDNREQQLRQIREAFRSKNISVDELAKVANEEWIKTQKEKRSVTYVPTQLLRQYSDMTLQLAAMFTTPTQDLEQAIRQVQGFFETTTDEAKLATAAKVMMGQMKRSGQTFSDIEKEEINYILDNIIRLEKTASILGFELEKNMRVFKETADVNINANIMGDMFNNGVASEIFDSIEEIANVYWDKLSIIPELVTKQYKQWLENEFYKISTPGGADSQVKVIDDVEDAIEDMEKTFVGGLNIEMDKFKDIVKNINNTFGSETNASNIDKRLKELNKQQESITNNIAVLERMKLAYSRQGQDVSVSELDANHEVKKAEIIKDTIEDYIITNPSPNRLSLDTLRDILSEQYEEPIVEELINWTRESAAKVNKLRGNKILHKSFTKPLARFMNPRLIPTGEETITLSNGDTVTLSTHSAPTKRNKDGTINHNVMNKYMHVRTDDDIRDFYAIREEYNDKLRHASHFDRTTVGMAILAGEGWNLDEIQKQLDIPDDKLPDYMKLANFSTAFDCASAGLDGVCELCDGVKKQCYAVRDASRLPKVTQNQIAKYIAFQLMSEEERIGFYENHGMPVRISQEGDFTNIHDYEEFLKIVKANPETTYYGYTKNEEVLAHIAEHGKPENLRMHNSLGTWDELNYIAVDLVDMVDYLKSGYKLCEGACLTCQQCFGDLEKFPEFKDINIVTVRRKGGDPLKKYKDIINNMELDKQIAFFADVQSLIRNEGATEKQAIEKAVENLTKMNVGNIDKNKVHHTKMKSPLTQEELLKKYGDDYFFLNPAVAYDIHKAESQGFQAISYVTPDEARKMIQMKGADISDFMPIRHVPGIETVRGSWNTYDDAQKENFFNVFLTNAEEHDNHLMVLTDKLYTTYKDILTDRYKEANKIRDEKDLPYVSSLRQAPWEFTPNAGMLMDEESPLGALLSIYNNMQSDFGSNTAVSYDRMLSLAYDLIKVRFKDKESDYNISEDDFYKWIKDNQDMIDDIFQLDGDRSFYVISDLFQHGSMSVPQHRYNTMKASQQRRKEQEEALLNSPEFSQIQDLIISSYDGLMREGYHKITYTLLRNRVEEEANRLKISMDNYHQIFARTTLAPDEYTWSQHEDNPNKVFLIDPAHMSKAPADMYVEEVPMNTAAFAKILPTTPEQAEDLLRDLLNNGKIIVTPSTDGSAHGSSSQGLIQITYDNDNVNTGFMTLHEFAHSVALHMARNMRGVKTKRKAGDYDEDFDHEVEANQIALNIMKLAGFVLKDEESLAYAQKRVKSHKGVLRRRGALDLVNEDVISSITEAFWLHIDDIIAVLNATYGKDFSFLKDASLLNTQSTIDKTSKKYISKNNNRRNLFLPVAGHGEGYLESIFEKDYPNMRVLGYGENLDKFQSFYDYALMNFREKYPNKKETLRNVLADTLMSTEKNRIDEYRILAMNNGDLINLKDKEAVEYGYQNYGNVTFKKLWGLTKKYKDLGFTQDDLLEWGVQAQDPQALKQFEIVNKKMFNAYKKHGDIGYWDWYNRITGEGKMGNFLETYKDIIPDIKTYLAEGMRFEAYTALIRQAKDIDYDDLDYEVSGDTLLSDDEKYSLQMEINDYRGGKFKPTHTSAQIPNLHDELYNELQQLIREEHELIESIMETRIQHHKDNIEVLNKILWEEINLPILYDNDLSDMENQEAKDERIYKQLIQEPSIPKPKDNRIKLTGEEMYDLVQASYWYNGGIGGNPQNTVDKYFTPIDAEKVKGKSLSEISFLNKDIAKNASYYVSKEDYEALKQVQSSYTLAQYGGQKAQTYVPGYMPPHYLNEAKYVYDKDKGRAVHADEYIEKKIAEGKSPDFLAPDNIRIPELQMLFDLYKDMGRSGIGYGLGTNQNNFQKFMRELFMSIDANENFTITNVRKLLQGHHSPMYLDEFLDNNENRIHNYGIYYDPKEWGRLVNLLDTDAVKEAFMNDYITERQLKKWEKIYYTPRVNSEGKQNTYNFGQDNFGDLGYNMEMVQQWKQEKENIKQAQDINKMEKTEMRNQMFPSFMQQYIDAMHNIEQYLKEVRDALENKNNGPTLKDFDTSATNSAQDAQRSKQEKDIAQNMKSLLYTLVINKGQRGVIQKLLAKGDNKAIITEIKRSNTQLTNKEAEKVAKYLIDNPDKLQHIKDSGQSALDDFGTSNNGRQFVNINENTEESLVTQDTSAIVMPGMGDYYAQISNVPAEILEQTGLTALEQARELKANADRIEKQLQAEKKVQDKKQAQAEKEAEAEKKFNDAYARQVEHWKEVKAIREREKRTLKEAIEACNELIVVAQNVTKDIIIRHAKGEVLSNAEVMALPNDKRTITTKDGKKKVIPGARDSEIRRNPQRALAMMFDRFDAEQAEMRSKIRHPMSITEREAYKATRLMFERFEKSGAYDTDNPLFQTFLKILSYIASDVKLLAEGKTRADQRMEFIEARKLSEKNTQEIYIPTADEWATPWGGVTPQPVTPEPTMQIESGEPTIAILGGIAYGGTESSVRSWQEEWEKIPEAKGFWEQKAQDINDGINKAGESIDDFLDEKLSRFSDDPSGLGKASRGVQRFTYRLENLQDAMTKAGNIFPPFLAIASAIQGVVGTLSVVTTGLATAETVLTAARYVNTKVTEEQAKEEGKEAAWRLAQKISGYADGHENIQKVIGKGSKYLTQAANGVMKYIDKIIGFVLENILIIGPIAAAIAAIVAGLWISEQNHAKALKEATEAQDKAMSEASASYIIYQNLHKARQSETDAAKRQQLARKESIALYDLESKRIQQLNAINKKSELRNDALWGEYGARAYFQKQGFPFIGEFESQYEKYEGSTGEIRRIKESSLENGGVMTKDQGAAAAWYDSHTRQLGQIEAFAPQLQELYETESRLIDKYGSKEAARNSKEFKEAVQEFADATGLNRETAEKYLDYLQTEANVENARKVMQAQVDMITAEATANAMKILYGDEAGMGDLDSVQDSMVYATADQIFKDAYNDLYWKMLMEWLNAIYNVITLNWGEADKHARAAGAYQEGMHQLAENQARITQEGVDVAKENQRKEYEQQSYSFYGDTPFGGAVASSAAMEQDWALEATYDAESKHYNANRMNGEAAAAGFRDGLDQHSPGKIARIMESEMLFSQEAIEQGGSSIMQKAYLLSNATANAFDYVTDGVYWVGRSIFNTLSGGKTSVFKGFGKSFNKSPKVQIDNSKTEIHIHTLNINTEDDPEKIKTAFMNLIVELGDLAVPRQVSRTIGEPPVQSTSTPTEDTPEGTDGQDTENNDSNNNTNNNSNNNPTT